MFPLGVTRGVILRVEAAAQALAQTHAHSHALDDGPRAQRIAQLQARAQP